MSPILYGKMRSPPCQAVLFTAKAIGVDIQLKEVDVIKTDVHKTETFLKMNPAHSIPTLDDNGFHIWESRAIQGYLVDQYAKDDHLYPKDPKKRALVNNILHFDNGTLYNSFVQYFFPILEKSAPNVELEAKLKERLQILDTILSRNAYAAGDHFTIADISLVASLSLPIACNYNFDFCVNIMKWYEKVKHESFEDIRRKAIAELSSLIADMTN